MLRNATLEDAPAIADIYNHYILNTVITFEEDAIDAAEMQLRMQKVTTGFPWLVWEEDGKVLGYAYADSWKNRCAYRNSVESTVYLHPASTGKGIGKALYQELIARLRVQGAHVVVGGIALPNAASVALHEHCGFEKVAQFKQIGFKFGEWIDVGYWELILTTEKP
jgi:L-amino acid N-acyltransferase YncA